MKSVNEVPVKCLEPPGDSRAPVDEQYSTAGPDPCQIPQKWRTQFLRGPFSRHGNGAEQRQRHPIGLHIKSRQAKPQEPQSSFGQGDIRCADEKDKACHIAGRESQVVPYIAELVKVSQQSVQIVGPVQNDFEQRRQGKNEHNRGAQGKRTPLSRRESAQPALPTYPHKNICQRAAADYSHKEKLRKVSVNQQHSRKSQDGQGASLACQYGSRAHDKKQ